MDVGLVGLAVMGQNLVLNMEEKGYSVAVYNRTAAKTRKFVEENEGRRIRGFECLQAFVESLKTPRIVILMVKSGDPVDGFLRDLRKHLAKGDVVIDGGNSSFRDTERRCGGAGGAFSYIGCGISGGEEGARRGPSLMPGGDEEGWLTARKVLVNIAAKSEEDPAVPCCEWIGSGGSGHFVKTLHNGIEYADMQLMADVYHILRSRGSPADEIAGLFGEWAGDERTSGFLMDISERVASKKDGGASVLDKIQDRAEQKGTGKWSAMEALELGVPSTLISEAVYARMISSEKDTRAAFSRESAASASASASASGNANGASEVSRRDLQSAFYLAKAIAYTQGFEVLRRASDAYGWKLNLAGLCRIWSGGCIIRSRFLQTMGGMLQEAAAAGPLETTETFIRISRENAEALRRTVVYAITNRIHAPCLASALSYYDGLSTERGPGNFIQALRDYFGAHTVQMIGSEEHVHLAWGSQ